MLLAQRCRYGLAAPRYELLQEQDIERVRS